jgi:hypothetical protein
MKFSLPAKVGFAAWVGIISLLANTTHTFVSNPGISLTAKQSVSPGDYEVYTISWKLTRPETFIIDAVGI